MSIEGQLTSAEAGKLIDLAQAAPKGSAIVEIGSYRGRSTTALAFGALKGCAKSVYAVDPHLPFVGLYGARFGPEDQAALYNNLSRHGVGKIVHVVSLPSLQTARAWSDQNIGLLWIDGDHSVEAVLADVEAWYPHILPGAVVAFHDNHGEGVRSAIDSTQKYKQLSLEGEVDTLSWLSKPLQDA